MQGFYGIPLKNLHFSRNSSPGLHTIRFSDCIQSDSGIAWKAEPYINASVRQNCGFGGFLALEGGKNRNPFANGFIYIDFKFNRRYNRLSNPAFGGVKTPQRFRGISIIRLISVAQPPSGLTPSAALRWICKVDFFIDDFTNKY